MRKDNKETLDDFALVLFCKFALAFNIMIPERIYQVFRKRKLRKNSSSVVWKVFYVNYCQNTTKNILN